jgi:hypothetical protein
MNIAKAKRIVKKVFGNDSRIVKVTETPNGRVRVKLIDGMFLDSVIVKDENAVERIENLYYDNMGINELYFADMAE